MIEKLLDKDIKIVEELFNLVGIKESIDNNTFTNHYVYKENNEIIGYINYDIMYERSELIQINVTINKQNNHIGSKLMDYMINDLINHMVKEITLEVKIDNIKAINLYKKYGFVEIGKRKGYYQGIDGILMKKELM